MKKLLGILVLGLLLSGCSPTNENFIGLTDSAIKPLLIIFLVSLVVVTIFVVHFNSANKKGYDFWGGLGYLIGPAPIGIISIIVLIISGVLLISFFGSVLVALAILMGIGALAVGYSQSKKK